MLLIVPHLHQGSYDSFRLAISLWCCRARELLPDTISHTQLRKSVMLRIPLKFFAVIRIGCLNRIGALLQDLTQKAPCRSGCLYPAGLSHRAHGCSRRSPRKDNLVGRFFVEPVGVKEYSAKKSYILLPSSSASSQFKQIIFFTEATNKHIMTNKISPETTPKIILTAIKLSSFRTKIIAIR